MTDDDKGSLAMLNYWSTRMEGVAGQFDDANSLGVRLPAAADGQLRNRAEAVSACQQVVESLVYRRDPSEEILRAVAGRLGIIARKLDNVVLPATVLD